MKRVVLLGDSIRLSYEATVRRQLAGVASVWSPAGNGQHTVNLLLNFWTWVIAQKPDVLHMNAGLWDTRRVGRDDGNLVPLDMYRKNIERLITLTQKHTRARIIWATTTPVDQVRADHAYAKTGSPGRNAADVPLYNSAAVEIAGRLDVEINDLYQAVLEGGPDRLLGEDGVHFTPAGSEYLGILVAKIL